MTVRLPPQVNRGHLIAKTVITRPVLASPPRHKRDLRNTPDGEGVVSVLERLTDMFSKLFGWDSDSGNKVLVIGLVSRLDPDTTTQSVPEPAQIQQTPQAGQVIDVQAVASQESGSQLKTSDVVQTYSSPAA